MEGLEIVAAVLLVLVVLFAWACPGGDRRRDKRRNQQNNRRASRRKELDVEVVVAHYAEDLSYLDEKPFSRFPQIIYHKGKVHMSSQRNRQVRTLPNVGRESHTYLTHIIDNYENLAELTVFLPGSCQDDIYAKRLRTRNLFRKALATGRTTMSGFLQPRSLLQNEGHFTCEEYASSHKRNLVANPESKLQLAAIRPLGRWLRHHFPGENTRVQSAFGILAVSRADIHRRPKQVYERLRKDLETHHSPESGFFFERSWGMIFHPESDCGLVSCCQ